MRKNYALIVVVFLVFQFQNINAQQYINQNFNNGSGDFVYADDLFKNTNTPAYADGVLSPNRGINNSGALLLTLGGKDDNRAGEMSGGWSQDIELASAQKILISFKFKLLQSGDYEQEERSEFLLAVDNELIGNANKTFVDQVKGDGNEGPEIGSDAFFKFEKVVSLSSGKHTIALGGYNNAKSSSSEVTTMIIDDVLVKATKDPCEDPKNSAAQKIVNLTDFNHYKETIKNLADFGDRTQGSNSYNRAEEWAVKYLEDFGYDVEFLEYNYQGGKRRSFYVTKVSEVDPQNMYIVSAHFDGRGGGGAANDDGSGSAIILNIARILSDPNIKPNVSIRMILWNNEETGLNGSRAYANARRDLRGQENPRGSGRYPEPNWLGVIQHDMMMFDHGLPPQTDQIKGADIDIEFSQNSRLANQSKELALKVKDANIRFATDYPSEITNNMSSTDSKSFESLCPSISLRENRRLAEIGKGADPHWHRRTDVYNTFSENDFRLGFNSLQSTLGAVASLSGAVITNDTCDTLSVKDNTLSNSIRIIPNPTRDFLTIIGPKRNFTTINLYTINGAKVKSWTKEFNKISIQEFSAGVYFLEINTDKETLTKKVLKK